jgi:signal peptidase II
METNKKIESATHGLIFRILGFLAVVLGIVISDQYVKAWIVEKIRLNSIGYRLWNDFLWIVHTRNLGIAFSIGGELSKIVRVSLFIFLPALFLVVAIFYSIRTESLSRFQRLSIYLIISGGLGNILDRIFRPEGVVDFLSFKFFGILGMERFPTFNIADASISAGAVLLLLSGFLWHKEIHDASRA